MFCFRYNTTSSASLVKNCLSPNKFCSQGTIIRQFMPRHFSIYLYRTTVSSRMTTASTTTGSSSPKWKLLSAICLERVPIISPPMTNIEQEISQMFEKFDRIQSLKSDHELRQDEDKYTIFFFFCFILFIKNKP